MAAAITSQKSSGEMPPGEKPEKYPLHKAAKDGNLDQVQSLVHQGEDITAKNDEGEMVLHCAAMSSEQKVVEYLVSQGADVNCKTEGGSNPLANCSLTGNMDMVKYFISLGADVFAVNKLGCNALHWAARSSNTDLVDYLVNSLGLDVNCKTGGDRTPLLFSSTEGNLDMFKHLISLGADVNATDKNGLNVMHKAALSSNTDLVDYLVNSLGLDVNCKTGGDRTPLLFSSMEGNLDMFKHLISLGADVNATDKNGLNVMHKAALSSNTDLVDYLVNSLGLDVNCRTGDNRTPLLFSSTEGNLDMFKHLISLGADVNATDKNGLNVMHKAALSSNTDLVDYLVNSLGLDVNCRAGDDSTPLLFSSLKGNLDMFKHLISLGADVNATNKNGWNVMQMASQFISNTDLVDYLVNSLSLDVNCRTGDDSTPLLFSSTEVNLDMFKHLISLGADVNATDKNGWNVMHMASQSSSTDLVDYLVNSLGLDVNCRTGDDSTPLLISSTEDNLDMFKHLISLGADVNATDKNGLNVMRMASLSSNTDLVDYLVNSLRLDVNCRTGDDSTPLLFSSLKGNLDMFKHLISLGADVNATDKKGLNVMHVAAQSSSTDLVDYLVNSLGLDVNCRTGDDSTPLLFSSTEVNLDMFKHLISLGADVNATDKNGWNVMHLAALSSRTDLVDYLVNSLGLDVNCRTGDDSTPLLISSTEDNLDMFKHLISLGADVNATDKNGLNVMRMASLSSNTDLVDYLVNSIRLDVNCRTGDDSTPLLLLLLKGNLDMFKHLISLGADVNATDKKGLNVMHVAAQSSSTDLVDYLVNSLGLDVNYYLVHSLGLDVNCRTGDDSISLLALLLLSLKGNLDMFKHLISLGADVNATDENGLNVMHMAALSSNTDLVDYLVNSLGLDVNCRIGNDSTPLLFSSWESNLDMFKHLISLGADVKATDKNGLNVMHWAARSSNTDLVDYLVNSLGLDVNCRTGDNRTPLLFSSLKGNLDMFKHLISLGADVKATDKNGLNVMHMASQSSNTDLVDYLVNSLGLDVNCRTGDNRTPLLFSSLKGNLDMFKHLISLGADVNATDKNGLSVMHMASRSSNTDLVDYLVNSLRLDVNCRAGDDSTPLLISSSKGNLDMFKHLISLGADVNTTDKKGLNVLHMAALSSSTDLVDYLGSLGVNPKGEMLKLFDTSQNRKVCGSVAERCRVGLPNEMDILFLYEERSTHPIPVHSGYAQYSGGKIYLPSGSRDFHRYFFDELETTIESKPSGYGLKYYQPGDLAGPDIDKNRKACSPILLDWESNKLRVSVDAVPCVHFDDWREEFKQSTWLMDHNELKKWGYLLVPKPPYKKSKLAKQLTEQQLEGLWRISFSHLEVEHINSLENRIKNVYITAKCLKNPDVCRIMIAEGEGLPKNVDDYISSYQLKSMFLMNAEDFRKSEQSLGEMVCKVYEDLADALHKGFIPTFFAPGHNVLAGLKLDVAKSAKVASIMKAFVRRLCRKGEETKDVGVDIKCQTATVKDNIMSSD
ncbi:serine/threonine-protein phosphatase 6 regulatory ankyrin repeat subunit B-like [Lineus longissimus]|uniref:serine/threonine-protein phosphatase 6 regulatory ankyrin repeat subunit B-like n=1 Tax=Lineus longissimus TaxID=88925 RepID=UPI00315CE91A